MGDARTDAGDSRGDRGAVEAGPPSQRHRRPAEINLRRQLAEPAWEVLRRYASGRHAEISDPGEPWLGTEGQADCVRAVAPVRENAAGTIMSELENIQINFGDVDYS